MNNFDNYRIFYHVVSCENMRQASQLLGLTPSTVSRNIQALEEELGCQLFSRTKRGSQLTRAGEILFARVRPAFGLIQAGENELKALINVDSGQLSIGVSDMISQQFIIPHCLKHYCRLYPHVSIRLRHMSNKNTIEALASGEIDLAVKSAVVMDENTDLINIIELYNVNDIAVVGSDYAHLSGKELTLDELTQLPLVFVPEGFSVHGYYSSLFKKHGLPFHLHVETPAIEEQLLAVEAGLGYTFLPEISARRLISEGRLFPLNIVPNDFLKRPISLFTPKDFPLTHAAQAFVDVMLRSAGEIAMTVDSVR